jgi:hypothetical protein
MIPDQNPDPEFNVGATHASPFSNVSLFSSSVSFPLAIAMLLISASATAQKLDKVREDVREGGSGSPGEDDGQREDQAPYWGDGTDVEDYQNPSTCPPDDPYCEETTATEILFGYVFGFAFWIPHVIAEGDAPREGWFAGYPYRGDNEGYMVFAEVPRPTPEVETTDEGDILIGEGDELITPRPLGSSPLAVRLAAEYGHDLGSTFKPWAGFLLSTKWRFGLESGATLLIEDLGGDEYDRLGIADINLIYRFAQHEHVVMRTGLGGRMMVDEGRVDGGFNWTYGFDVFPVQPIIFSTSIDLGNIMLAFFMHFRAHLGVNLWAIEAYAGWDVMLIGDVTFHGPIVGLRAWF